MFTFGKVASPEPATIIKNELRRRYFSIIYSTFQKHLCPGTWIKLLLQILGVAGFWNCLCYFFTLITLKECVITRFKNHIRPWNMKISLNIQFHWQLETTNSHFWLVNILLRKFDTSSKKEMKMIKTQVTTFYELAPLTLDVICSKL